VERVEGHRSRRRPDRVRRGVADIVGVKGEVEEGPEKGDEEADLAGDEQHHPVTKPEANHRRMRRGVALQHHVAPPARHHRGGEHDAETEHPPVVEVGDQDDAEHDAERGERADDRPGARLDEVVGLLQPGAGDRRHGVVVRVGVRGAHSFVRCSFAVGQAVCPAKCRAHQGVERAGGRGCRLAA
jgi:hypothetical protein